jgi:hypothetical protein
MEGLILKSPGNCIMTGNNGDSDLDLNGIIELLYTYPLIDDALRMALIPSST